jgi:hypothetical protein
MEPRFEAAEGLMKSNRVSGGAIGSLAALFALLASACAHQMGKNAAMGAAQEVANSQAANADDPSRQVSRVFAQRATEGALAAFDAPEQRQRMQQLVNMFADQAIEGSVAALDAPAQRERIQKIVDAAVAQAVASAFRSTSKVLQGGGASGQVSPVASLVGQVARTAVDEAVRELVANLGAQGQGPLAMSLAATSRDVSAAAVGSALDQLNELFPGCRGPDAVACVNRQIAGMSQSAAIGFSAGLRQTIGWALLIFAGLIGLLMGLLSHWLWSHRGPSQLLRTRTT